jgi:hypothetical protein
VRKREQNKMQLTAKRKKQLAISSNSLEKRMNKRKERVGTISFY